MSAAAAATVLNFETLNAEQLTAQLDERALIYKGMGQAEAEQLRGHILSRFAATGLPDDALPYLREELETGDSRICIAAAAKALSGAQHTPDWAAPALISAIERLLYADDMIRFTPSASIDQSGTTVLQELFGAFDGIGDVAVLPRLRELASMKPRPFGAVVAATLERTLDRLTAKEAPCCCGGALRPQMTEGPARSVDTAALRALRLEDQSGKIAQFDEIFDGKLNIIAFFYTRCMNPEKCSCTIEKLAALQTQLGALAPDCRLGAISYDPAFDTIERLRTYGGNRGIDLRSPVRLLRCLDGVEPLMTCFDLSVGFGDATVNRHRIEVFMLDRDSKIVSSIVRRQWTTEEALTWIERFTKKRSQKLTQSS